MAQRAICCLVVAAFSGGATAASVSTLPGGALLKGHRQKVDHKFESFLLEHKREYKYGTAEYDMRKSLFSQRLSEVHTQNARPDHEKLWQAGTSLFSDRTEAELQAVRGLKKGAYSAGRAASLLQSSSNSGSQPRTELPKTMSWMNLTTARQVKQQGGCGSCWAVATISALEAHYEIYKQPQDPLRSFSVQQTVDCTPNPHRCGGYGGCGGATVELGMAWILQNGIASAEDVPYTGGDGSCSSGGKMQVLAKASPNQKGGASFGLLSYSTLPVNEGYPLREALVKYGPVAVSAAAGMWFTYRGGVFNNCGKDSTVDHAITAYGYGETDDEKKTKYWKLRNSWGISWGENGFIRLLRHDDRDDMTDDERFCGTDHYPEKGLGCEDGPSSVKICGMCGILYDSVVPYFQGAPTHGGGSTQTTEDVASLFHAGEGSSIAERWLEDEASFTKFKGDAKDVSVIRSGDAHDVPKLMRAEAERH